MQGDCRRCRREDWSSLLRESVSPGGVDLRGITSIPDSSEVQITAMSGNDVCIQCGKPKVGVLVQSRLGRDEAPTFVVCVCDADRDQRDLADSVAMLDRLAKRSFVDELGGSGHDDRLYGGGIGCHGDGVLVNSDDEESTALKATVTWAEVSESKGSIVERAEIVSRQLSDAVNHASCKFAHFEAGEMEVVKEYEIRIDRNLSKRMFQKCRETAEAGLEVGFPAVFTVDSDALSARVQVRSKNNATVKVTLGTRFLCPGMSLCESIEGKIRGAGHILALRPDACSQAYRISVDRKTVLHSMWSLRMSYYPATGKYSAELEFPSQEAPLPLHVSAAIEWLHTFWGHVDALTKFVPNSLVAGCKAASISVVDVARPPDGNCIYRVKADGELRWLVKWDAVMYCCIPDRHLTVISWNVLGYSQHGNAEEVTIMRAEQLASGQCVFIDVLTENGDAAAPSRRHVAGSALTRLTSPAMVLVRSEFASQGEAEEDRKVCGFPTDGVVAIDVATSMTYRLKRPTIDMQAVGGTLKVAHGDLVVPEPKALPWMKEGRVYEMGIARGGRGLTFTASCPRPDKVKPNTALVANDIITSVLGNGDEAAMTGRFVTSLSFAVRSKVYEYAANRLRGGNLVIDVGSGRLQSKEIMAKYSASWLLCDPSLDTRGLRHRVTDITNMDGLSIVASMKNADLKQGKYLAYRSSFESLMAKPEVSEFVRRHRTPVVYCFSLSHVMNQFVQLSSRAIPQVACGFVYDGHDPDGYVFNLPGAKMRVVDARRRVGEYLFGSDPWASEPMLTVKSIGSGTRVMYVDEMELPDFAIPVRMLQISQRLVMVTL